MKIGIAKTEITAFIKGVGMLGYGYVPNIIKTQNTPQYARAYIFEQNNTLLVWVCAEICFITDILKLEVLKHLESLLPNQCTPDNLMLTAQHTHSGAGGYQQHLFYNIPFDGLQPEVLHIYAQGIANAIYQAYQQREEGSITFHKSPIAENEEVAFNRSLLPYNANPENTKHTPESRHLALDREMKLIAFYDKKGNLRGSINWFGVHTTSISKRNTAISYDNKGYAAKFLEDNKTGIHAFAQDTAGDISPNFIWNKKYKEYRGKYENENESAAFNGDIQYRKAKEILNTPTQTINPTHLDYIAGYTDWSTIQTSVEGEQLFTAQSALGISFLEGTTDGQGAPKTIGNFTRNLVPILHYYEKKVVFRRLQNLEKQNILRNHTAQAPKIVVVEAQRKRLLLAPNIRRIIIPKFFDPSIACFKKLHEKGFTNQNWLPNFFQFQIFIIQNIAIVGMPCEVTTTAGKRLRETALNALAALNIQEVIISSYANGYAGYLTTPEEYEFQFYEGGHTPFGKWTLPCCQEQLAYICQNLYLEKNARNLTNFITTPPLLPKQSTWTANKNYP